MNGASEGVNDDHRNDDDDGRQCLGSCVDGAQPVPFFLAMFQGLLTERRVGRDSPCTRTGRRPAYVPALPGPRGGGFKRDNNNKGLKGGAGEL